MTNATIPTTSDTQTESPASAAVEEVSQQLQLEISKMLLSETLATVRGAMQILQGLSGILLASYTSILVGLGKQIGIDKIPAIVVALPIVFYTLSLLSGFVQIVLYRGAQITLGDLISGVKAYETVVSTQRKFLILPLILSFAGLVSLAIVITQLLSLQRLTAP